MSEIVHSKAYNCLRKSRYNGQQSWFPFSGCCKEEQQLVQKVFLSACMNKVMGTKIKTDQCIIILCRGTQLVSEN